MLYNAQKAAAAPTNDFAPVPNGVYRVLIEDIFLEGTKKGGTMIKLKLQIVDGDYQGRYVFENLNIICPGSETAEAIAHKNLASICEQLSVNPEELKEESDLQSKLQMRVISVDVKITDNTYNGETKKINVVKSYQPKGVSASTPTSPQGDSVKDNPYGGEAPF